MTRRTITGALVALALLAAFLVPAPAQAQGTVIVPAPAPSASPGTTVITPGPAGTTVVAPPGSTVTVQPPPATAVVAVQPWCAGAYSTMGGTNFGGCAAYLPR
jgi:hypothetical protein